MNNHPVNPTAENKLQAIFFQKKKNIVAQSIFITRGVILINNPTNLLQKQN